MPGDSSAPKGADESRHERSHGLRDAENGVAAPAATPRRPVGAKKGRARDSAEVLVKIKELL